jgi:hypothetical protein
LYIAFPELKETFIKEDVLENSDVVLLLTDHPNWSKMDYYAGYYFAFVPGGHLVVNPWSIENENLNDPNSLSAHLASSPSVWLAYAPARVAEETVSAFLELLETYHEPCDELIQTDELLIQHYAQPSFGCEQIAIPDTALVNYQEENIQLADVIIKQDGAVGLVAAAWQIDGTVPLHTYSSSWQLFDATGEKVAQVDYELPASSSIWRMARFDLSSLDTGNYEVEVIAYNWQTGTKLTEQMTGNSIIPVGAFSIEALD